ncbi:MAG: rhamnulose-1-phosphate aldolase [candidate division WOR-3 bacterium]|nr:rhamnulose-1-phosphate aldolase [candidate division WOR-3 bacterium]
MLFKKSRLKKVIEDIGEVGTLLWQKGWAERNAGNVSVDVTEIMAGMVISEQKKKKIVFKIPDEILADRFYLVTATGARLRDTKKFPEENILLVMIDKKLDGYYILNYTDSQRPSTSEFISHLLIYAFLLRNNRKERAILHTHPNHIIALTHIKKYANEKKFNKLIWSIHPEVKVVIPEGAGFVPYRCPGTEELGNETIKRLKNHRIVIWEKHGCVAVGKDLLEAFDLIDTINKSAELFFICKSAGFEPEGLSDRQIKGLIKNFNLRSHV